MPKDKEAIILSVTEKITLLAAHKAGLLELTEEDLTELSEEDEENKNGRDLQKVLDHFHWQITTLDGRNLEPDELSFLVGVCYSITKN